MVSFIPVAVAALLSTSVAQAAAIPEGKELERVISDLDAKLFWSTFEACTPEKLDALLTPNFRMIHDLGGLIASTRAEMIANETRSCAERAPGGAHAGYRNRRLPVPGSRIVRPMGKWGALEEGAHVFFEWNAARSQWDMVGGGRYQHLWRWIPDEGKFRLDQSYSYDHGDAGRYPPASDAAGQR